MQGLGLVRIHEKIDYVSEANYVSGNPERICFSLIVRIPKILKKNEELSRYRIVLINNGAETS